MLVFDEWDNVQLAIRNWAITIGDFASVDKIRGTLPEGICDSSIDWFFAAVDSKLAPQWGLLLEALYQNFSGVRLFHSTRLPNYSGIQEHGLIAWSEEQLRQRMSNILQQVCPEASQADVSYAIKKIDLKHRADRVYFFLSQKCASARFSDHYLAFGSEAIYAASQYLCRDREARLQAFGVPAIVVCDIPWDQIDIHTQQSIAGILLLLFVETAAGRPPDLWGKSIYVQQSITATCICEIIKM